MCRISEIFLVQFDWPRRGYHFKPLSYLCYDLKSLEEDERTTLVLSNTRELDRVPSTE